MTKTYKVHPIGMRVGIIRDWDVKWYAEKEYNSEQLNTLFSKLNAKTGISDITICEVNTIELYK